MSFTITLVLSAFLLAIWSDVRFERLRPTGIGRRIGHVAAACILLQVVSIGAGALVRDAGVARRLVGVLARLLPGFVYPVGRGRWPLLSLVAVCVGRPRGRA